MADEKRFRMFFGIIWKDTTSYNPEDVIKNIEATTQLHAFILHDSDTLDDGTPKKAHYHFVARTTDAHTFSAMSKKWGIPANDIEKVRSWDRACQYLIHANDPDKFQYDIADIKSNFEIRTYLDPEGKELEEARLLFDVACSGANMKALVRFSLDHNCWSSLRRSSSIWSAIINENRLEAAAAAKDAQRERRELRKRVMDYMINHDPALPVYDEVLFSKLMTAFALGEVDPIPQGCTTF